MANRREFLHCSAAASMLVLSPGLRAAPNAPDARLLYKVLFDARHAESHAFAAAFAEQGVAIFGMANGNITQFWRNELADVWALGAAPVAGLTDESVLFCLEQLGWQHGLRVLQRDVQASGLVAWVIA